MKWILVILNTAMLLGTLLLSPTVRYVDLMATQSIIQDLERSGVLNREALAKHIVASDPGRGLTPERRLAVMLHHGRGMRLLLLTPVAFLLFVNTVCIAAFWRKASDGASKQTQHETPKSNPGAVSTSSDG